MRMSDWSADVCSSDLVDGELPARQVSRILAEAASDVADRADAQAHQVAVGVGGVAHEVAVQAAARLGLGEVVVGQREMIHADVGVAGRGELFDRQLQQAQLGLRRRQVFSSVEQPSELQSLMRISYAVFL